MTASMASPATRSGVDRNSTSPTAVAAHHTAATMNARRSDRRTTGISGSVNAHWAFAANVAFSEVGLKDSTLGGVGGAFLTVSTREVGAWQAWLDAA